MIDEEPVQRIYEDVEFEIEYYDLTAAGTGSAAGEIDRPFVRPFDLSRPPLLRVRVIKEENNRHILSLDIHHIVTDGTSMGILLRDFIQIYERKEPVESNIRYRDYAEWQNRLLRFRETAKQRSYWLKQFAGEVPVLDLASDYPYPAPGERTNESGIETFEIDRRTAVRIDALLLEEVTLYMFLLAVFNILMFKYSGQEDIVVGSGTAGRRLPDLEHVLGIFIEVLPMRNRPRKDMPFSRFLQEVKGNALKAFENQDYPYEELVRELNLHAAGKVKGNPLFDVAFQLQNLDTPAVKNSGFTLKPAAQETHYPVRYDITIYAWESPAGINLTMLYAGELFKQSTAQKMAEHYLEILNQVLDNRHIILNDIETASDLLQVDDEMLQADDGDFNF